MSILTDLSPSYMLGSCVILGCCVSSFAHRRQDHDKFQSIIFVAMVLWGVTVGRGMGISANLITLSLVPGALCTAMIMSFSGHEFARWLVNRPSHQGRPSAQSIKG